MKMPDLRCMRRHSFLDDTQRIGLDEVPSVAILTPIVVFCMKLVDHTYLAYDKRSNVGWVGLYFYQLTTFDQ